MAVKRWRAGHASSRQCGRAASSAVLAAQASGGVPFWWLWWGRALTVLCCVWWLSLPLMDCQAEEAPTPPSTTEATGQHWTTTSEGHWNTNSGVHWSHAPLMTLAAEEEEEATGGASTVPTCSFHDWSTIWQPCKRKLRPGQTIHIRCPANALYHPVDWRQGDTGEVCETPITRRDMQPYCAKPRKWWDTAPVATWATVLQDMSVQHTIVLLHDDKDNTADGAAAAAAAGPHQHDGPLTVHGACFGADSKKRFLYWSIELLLPENSKDKNKNDDDNKNDNKNGNDNKNDDNDNKNKNDDNKNDNDNKNDDNDNKNKNDDNNDGKDAASTAEATGPPTEERRDESPSVTPPAEEEEEATGGASTDDTPTACSFHDQWTITRPCKRKLWPGQPIHIICPANALYPPVDWRRGDTGEVCAWPVMEKGRQPYCAKPLKWRDTAPVVVSANVQEDKTVQHTITLNNNDNNNNTVDRAAAAAAGPHQHDGPRTVHGACFGGKGKAEFLYWSIELMLPKTTEDKNTSPHGTTTTPTLRFDQSERKEDEVVTVALRQGESFEVACDEGATVDPPDALTPSGGHFCRSLAVASPRPCPTAAAALWSSVDAAVEVAAAAAVDDAAKKTTTAKGVKATIVVEGRPKGNGNAAAFSCTRKDGVMTVFFLFFPKAAAVGTPPPPPSSSSSPNLAIRSLKRCPTTTHDDHDHDDGDDDGKEILRVRRGAGHRRHHQSETKEKKKKEGTVGRQLEERCDVTLSPNDVLAIDCYDRPELFPADVASPAGSFCAKPFPWPKDWKCEGGDLVRWDDVLAVRLAGGGERNDEGMFAVVNTTTKQTPFVAYGRCYNPSTGAGLSIAATFLPHARPDDDDEEKKDKTTKTTITENSADNKTTTTNNSGTNNTTHDSNSTDAPSSSVRGKGSMANASPPSLFLAAALSAVLAAVAGGL